MFDWFAIGGQIKSQIISNVESMGVKVAAPARLTRAGRRKTIIKCCGAVKCQDAFSKTDSKK
jgi:hypothetical protein